MTLQELVEATAQGRLDELLESRGGELTPALAAEARDLFKRALAAGDGGLAQAAVMTATMAWLRLGDRHESLVNYVDWQQLEYMRAETPPDYAAARENLLRARGMAEEIGARDQAFKAATIAADCSFWAAQASEPQARDELLLQTLRDLVAASGRADPAAEGEFERYVSLFAAAAGEARSTVWLDPLEAEANAVLAELATAADATIPADFSYRQAGDAEKTAQTAEVLAWLADEHGS